MKRFHLVGVIILALVFGFNSSALAKNPAIISTDDAPEAVGPYSQGAKFGNLVFTAGQIAIDPDNPSNALPNDITKETAQVMKNLKAILKDAKLTFDDVVMTTVYLKDLGQFNEFNRQYARDLGCEVYELNGSWVIDCAGVYLPPRATIEAASLPRTALVEISMIAGK